MNWNGNADLRPLLVEVDGLHLDPANTNVHDEESVAAIAASYAEYGQQRPIVVSGAGVAKAGNGQLMAARRLGWTHLAVSRSDLPDVKLALFGIADNRTAEFSKRDEAAVAVVLDLARDAEPIEATGYSLAELDALLDRLAPAEGGPPAFEPGGDGPIPPAEPAPMLSQVRMVQLFLSVETLPLFQGYVEALMPRHGTDNLTDTVMACLRAAAGAES